MAAIDELDRPHGDAGGFHIDEDEGNALLFFLGLWVGTGEHENPVGILAERGPGFLAVDDVEITLAPGCGFQAGEVRAAPGSEKPWHHQMSRFAVGARNFFFCASEPKAAMTGPTIETLKAREYGAGLAGFRPSG